MSNRGLDIAYKLHFLTFYFKSILFVPGYHCRGDLPKWQGVRVFVSVCGDGRVIRSFYVVGMTESVCSDYIMWRCVSMFGLEYVAMCQYVRIRVCDDVSVCLDYSM
jgi:hypothetical protein